jgi:PAS domain S-box-containing protein
MPLKQPASNIQKKKKIILGTDIKYQNADMQNIWSMMEKLLHWAAIIDSSDDAIISKSIDGFITSWNKGAQRLYGYTPKEIIGKPVSILMPPEKKDDFPFIMSELHKGKRIEHYETKRQTKDGRILDVSITVSPIRDSQGTIIGASKIARDITEKKEDERRRDDFVSTVSHELKTPITSQKIFGELLEKMIIKKGDTELLSYIQKINKQTSKMIKLVEDLLDLSRMQKAFLRIEKKVFSIDELLDEVKENIQLTTEHIIIKEDTLKANVCGDKERIGQVLLNLINNAIKYSRKKGKIILTENIKDDYVVIGIQDFGIGIASQHFNKIFERFYRVNDDEGKTYPGMGIGLFLSREIIERHNGKLWVESTYKKGSTFFFTLPLYKSKR